MSRRLRSAAVAALCLLAWTAVATAAAPARPRLVVLISIDQFRADYLERFQDLFLPPGGPGSAGGFRYLVERGAYQTDAHHDHYPLFTGPGHSIHLTGAPPYKTGIVGNEWFDREWNAERYCDHGVAPMVEAMKQAGFATATAYQDKALEQAADSALGTAFGPGSWAKGLTEFNFYLDLDALRGKGIEPAKAEAVVAEALRRQPGVYAAYTRTQIVEGRARIPRSAGGSSSASTRR
jgi:hypothetical protein